VYEYLKKDLDVELKDANILKVQRREKRKEIKLLEVASNINDRICEELVRGSFAMVSRKRKYKEKSKSLVIQWVLNTLMRILCNHETLVGGMRQMRLSKTEASFPFMSSSNMRAITRITTESSDLVTLARRSGTRSNSKDALKNYLSAVKPGAEAMDAIIAAVNTHDYVMQGNKVLGLVVMASVWRLRKSSSMNGYLRKETCSPHSRCIQ